MRSKLDDKQKNAAAIPELPISHTDNQPLEKTMSKNDLFLSRPSFREWDATVGNWNNPKIGQFTNAFRIP